MSWSISSLFFRDIDLMGVMSWSISSVSSVLFRDIDLLGVMSWSISSVLLRDIDLIQYRVSSLLMSV